jgi:hypothetical protein
MTTRSHESVTKAPAHEKGQRLHCHTCGAEIEIISPCTRVPQAQVLRCCGRDMTPQAGVPVNPIQ